jgi:hypothetical protein
MALGEEPNAMITAFKANPANPRTKSIGSSSTPRKSPALNKAKSGFEPQKAFQ